jgi:beta-glucosidase
MIQMPGNDFDVEELICNESFQEYCLGASLEHQILWKEWMAKYPDRKEDIAEAERIVSILNVKQGSRIEQLKALRSGLTQQEVFQSAMSLKSGISSESDSSFKEEPLERSLKVVRPRWYVYLGSSAAAILIAITFLYFYKPAFFEAKKEQALVHFSSGKALRKTIVLKDGSVITLAKDDKEAIMIAINAGIDMSMIAYNYETFCENLIALVKEGKVKESRIDDAVRRILWVKYELNLFEKPTTNPKDYPKFGSKEFEQAAYQTAAESITLLKNTDQVLPLAKGTKILVTGPNANSMRTLNGAWTYSWQGEKVEEFAAKYNTILEALQQKAGKENVSYLPGVSYKMDGKYYDEYADQMEETIAAAKNAEVIVLCLGENSYTESPGNMNDLYLSDLQTELAQKLAATGKKVVLVLNEGRPRVISKFEQKMNAIVQTYLPGNFGGDALAAVLYGEVNPSGKLPYTYPQFPNALFTYYHKPSESKGTTEGVYNYDSDYNPQYVFGHGLSYTTFKYDQLKLSSNTLKKGESLTITVNVSNTGMVDGKETVLLFTSDLVATLITPDVKRLRGFEKIELKAGETKNVTFKISPEDIGFINTEHKLVTEAGEFTLQIADQKVNFNYIP